MDGLTIQKIKRHLFEIGVVVDKHEEHDFAGTTYMELNCFNTMDNTDTTVIVKVNSDKSYKIYAELD